MIDRNGLNDACYADVLASAGALSVGLALTFPSDVEFTEDSGTFAELTDSGRGAVLLAPDLLKRNPQLVRIERDGGHRVYHPSFGSEVGTVQYVQFDRWVDWSKAANSQLVFRRKFGGPFLVAARFNDVNRRPRITFDPPKHGGRYAYVNLDFLSNTDAFNPVYFRVGDGTDRRYLSVRASLGKKGIPIVQVNRVRQEDSPDTI
ncbi:MAG TPA: hypothetical protein VD862_01140 [Candidatus Paceibacterota bacterium]|nr:hypothetical protein [Candidatus Paceibacterota bacterium]